MLLIFNQQLEQTRAGKLVNCMKIAGSVEIHGIFIMMIRECGRKVSR